MSKEVYYDPERHCDIYYGECIVETEEIHPFSILPYFALICYIMMSGWFILALFYLQFGKQLKYPITITLAIIGIIWIYAMWFDIIPTGFA
ncbi:hypothetical protein SKA08_15615 [Enterococcus faecium]